jgi:hypothetical protein
MKTAFSEERMRFTKAASIAAQQQLYPKLFPGEVHFEDVVQTTQDLEYAIDTQLTVAVSGLKGPIRFAVQERFRNPEEMHWGDVTVTEWNLATNQPSELHKLGAQLFVYGFYDEPLDHISLAVVVDVCLMQWAVTHSAISYSRERRGDQSFVGFKFRDLERAGAILFRHDERERRAELLLRQENADVTDSWREDEL